MINSIKNKIIVSCQAVGDEPLNDVKTITLMAKAVLEGGAEFLRLSQEEHINSIKKITNVPIIGLIKEIYNDSEIVITPTLKEVKILLSIGVECIAIDFTSRKRPNEEKIEDLINYIRKNSPKTLIMADCSNEEDVKKADIIKVDLIGTTLRGYTKETKNMNNIENDFYFIRKCKEITNIPIIAEGGFWEHDDIYKALEKGAHSVVVGSAITRPLEITKKFLKEHEKRLKGE